MISLLITSVLCLGFLLGAIISFGICERLERKHRKTMKKFEYYSFTIDSIDDADRALDELGKDGWEVYAVANSRIYLKRELP